jgi:hypothetical protein
MGPAVHPRVHRSCPVLPPRSRRPLVRRRDLCEGVRPADPPVGAIDQHGQLIDAPLSDRRDLASARRFFIRALRAGPVPAEVTTDRVPACPRVLEELIPSAMHTVERHADNPVETDHGWLKARPRPMHGLKRHESARIITAGHALVQNLRRGHCELASEAPPVTVSTSIRPARDDHLNGRTITSSRPVIRAGQPTQHCRWVKPRVGGSAGTKDRRTAL